jgi:hypothetical protein
VSLIYWTSTDNCGIAPPGLTLLRRSLLVEIEPSAGGEIRYETLSPYLAFPPFADAANDPLCCSRGRKGIPLLQVQLGFNSRRALPLFQPGPPSENRRRHALVLAP